MESNERGLQVFNFESLLKLGYAVIDVRYREYEVANESYKLVITQVESDREDFYPNMLKYYIGTEFKDKNVFEIWIKILKHKLRMSEILNRDISIKVAALDFFETGEKQ
ncbi:MAG: hypothetical protein PHR06_04890 [Candidatus Cloacimonetes bacterium]|nr:hypothetical protein [Candidatus Cloacimonadota bacterium]